MQSVFSFSFLMTKVHVSLQQNQPRSIADLDLLVLPGGLSYVAALVVLLRTIPKNVVRKEIVTIQVRKSLHTPRKMYLS